MQGSIEKRGSIGIIWIDNPPVNAISHAVREGLVAAVESAAADDDIDALVLACRGRTFMAGADISEFASGPKPPRLGEVVDKLGDSPKLIVAALFGTAFGGGLEVALACNYRIALSSAKIGLPEVKLGIIPGAQGTQRLPRLAGVDFALKLIVSGNPVPAAEALEAGAIDRVEDGDIVAAAVAYAEELVAGAAPLRKSHEMTLDASRFDDDYFAGFRKSIARRTRGMHAPERAIQAVEAAVNLPFGDGAKRERELIMECMADPQAKALQHVFFAEREATKVPGLPRDVELKPIRSVGVIGAGTMGGGISMNFVNVGIPVTILEMNDEALEKGLGTIRKNYENSARKGRISDAQVEERMGLLTGTTEYGDLADVDLVIEAVFENMDVKKTVFSTLNETVGADAILATNTSYLDINEIATVVENPERVLGMHFFSPANVMRLLEIVRAQKTAPEVLATILKLAKTINKAGAVAGVCFGFIGNRMLSGYGREAQLLLLEGAAPEQVDRVLYDFGMPMGVIAMGDLAGLDIGYRLRQQLDESAYDVRATYVPDRLVEMGRLGQKTGAGTYDYEPGNRTPIPSPVTQELIAEAAEKFGIEQREISDEEIIERCFYSLFNIGCDVLDEGMAFRASDIDIVYINGYGFPAWRGGPMYWAENAVGLGRVLERIREFAELHGERWWRPSPLLERLVADGGTLRDITNE
ncbi:MAG: enoyl-CoA hydratase/isomerase family protein [Gammaproteobacteria bacterium]|nr:enoyl-CoA hydratase/isomerase family protein [Gammaproteobacteria bacterium]